MRSKLKSGSQARETSPSYGSWTATTMDLQDLLKMKLTSFRLKDQVHVQDLLDLKLISRKVVSALPSDLKARLEQVKKETKREQLF